MENEKGAFTDELIKKIKKNDRSLRKINITGKKKKTQYSNEGFTEKGMGNVLDIVVFLYLYISKTS